MFAHPSVDQNQHQGSSDMDEFIKFIREVLSMSGEVKGLSSWRFVAVLLTALLGILVWRLPEILAALNK